MKNIIGHYKLISHGTYSPEGVFQPTSPYLKGELIYSSEGFLSVQIFLKEEIESPRDLLTYSGKYKIVSDSEVEHHIHICSQSKRDNSTEKRSYKIEGGFLFLSIEFENKSKFEAKWQKLL